jgi:hypothetical protein
MCHCLACQRRTGSAFSMQARFPKADVKIEGLSTTYIRVSDEGEERTFNFCPECGSTVYYQTDPELIAIPIGAFADPSFPRPRISIYESRRHDWVSVPPEAERHD